MCGPISRGHRTIRRHPTSTHSPTGSSTFWGRWSGFCPSTLCTPSAHEKIGSEHDRIWRNGMPHLPPLRFNPRLMDRSRVLQEVPPKIVPLCDFFCTKIAEHAIFMTEVYANEVTRRRFSPNLVPPTRTIKWNAWALHQPRLVHSLNLERANPSIATQANVKSIGRMIVRSETPPISR